MGNNKRETSSYDIPKASTNNVIFFILLIFVPLEYCRIYLILTTTCTSSSSSRDSSNNNQNCSNNNNSNGVFDHNKNDKLLFFGSPSQRSNCSFEISKAMEKFPKQQQQTVSRIITSDDNKNIMEKDDATAKATSYELPKLSVNEKNRSIVLVHVGKAGGSTIRRNLDIFCHGTTQLPPSSSSSSSTQEKCKKHIERGEKLSLQTHSILHLWDKNDTAIDSATSFLVTIRNPVERIISAFRYSHPANCRREINNAKIWGCTAIDYKYLDKPTNTAYKAFVLCFPSPGIEDFAQALMKPERPNYHFENQNFTRQQAIQCREIAQNLVVGRRYGRNVPHMQCNYKFYVSQSLKKYPEKEVFAIRTEHEWDDMVALDKLLGGSGNFERRSSISHGSEHYYPSPISTEAYHKLCCTLEKEIEIYLDILHRALNIDNVTKQESEDNLREKCGVEKTWSEWRLDCSKGILPGSTAASL